jgi:outer membrane protein TolC
LQTGLRLGVQPGQPVAPQASPQTGVPQRLTLKQAVAQAIQSSREVSLARLRYLASQRETGVTRSRFRPNLYAGSGIAYTSGFPLVAGGGAPALFSLSYDQALFDRPGRAELHAAEQQTEQQRLEMQSVRDIVIVRTASTYLELAKVRRESDLLHKERDSAQQILDYTQKRLDAGYELPVEVTKAQLTAARIEQRMAQLEDQDDALSDQLRTLLGLGPDQGVEVAAEDIPTAANQTANDLVRQALQNSVDIKKAESDRAASEARLKGERGGYWPSISIIGQYNILARFNNYDQFFNKFERNNVIAGLDVKIPIFASRTSAAVGAAQANLATAQAALENKRSEVSADVRHKARQTKAMDMNREVARLELALAQDNLQVTQAQYQQGRISIRDMEAAQLEENDKWLAFLDADFARQQAQLDLLSTTGQVAALLQ